MALVRAIDALPAISAVLGAYLLGCLNTGYYLVRWRTGRDIRQQGSGNAGARNVARVLGRAGFALTLAGDALKGAAAIALARWVAPGEPALEIAALLAVVAGHVWPIQLRGVGGRGAATALGAALVFDPAVTLTALALGVVTLALTRRFTQSGLVAVAAAPFAALVLGRSGAQVTGIVLLAVLVLFAHRDILRAPPLAPHSAVSRSSRVSRGTRIREPS